jgi:hypothetical protein
MAFYNYLSHSPTYDVNSRNDDTVNPVTMNPVSNTTKPDNNKPVNTIYRYKFRDEFVSELYKFSKIHQYDHRKDFKEAWQVWVEDNDDIVSDEVRTLSNSGYDGDILDKMFKSARYYFRKKSTEPKEPVKRRKYCGLSKDVLDAMDKHIASNITNDDYKPSTGFESFCAINIALLKEESSRLITNGFKDSVEIHEKLKKTYKNRYFMFISK